LPGCEVIGHTVIATPINASSNS